jgi:amino acid permease-like protein
MIFALTLVVHGILNHYGVKLVATLNDLSVTVHILGVAANRCTLVRATKARGELFSPLTVMVGDRRLWSFDRADAGHPLGIRSAFGNRSKWQSDPRCDQLALGAKFGNAMAALASMAMWFCGLSCVTSASRAVYSLARDKGTPWASFFSRVNRKHGTLGRAIWAIVATSLALMVWSGAVPIVTSLSTVALYIGYIVPLIFAAKSRLAGSNWPAMSVWSLGCWGLPINVIVISYTVVISVVLVMPPNELSGKLCWES